MMEELRVIEDLTSRKKKSIFWLFSSREEKTDSPVANALVRFPVEVGGEGVR